MPAFIETLFPEPEVAGEPEITIRRAQAGEIGTHFIVDDSPSHRCRPACYRANRGFIMLLCDCGHSAGMIDSGPSFGGSSDEALLNKLPAFAPFIRV